MLLESMLYYGCLLRVSLVWILDMVWGFDLVDVFWVVIWLLGLDMILGRVYEMLLIFVNFFFVWLVVYFWIVCEEFFVCCGVLSLVICLRCWGLGCVFWEECWCCMLCFWFVWCCFFWFDWIGEFVCLWVRVVCEDWGVEVLCWVLVFGRRMWWGLGICGDLVW